MPADDLIYKNTFGRLLRLSLSSCLMMCLVSALPSSAVSWIEKKSDALDWFFFFFRVAEVPRAQNYENCKIIRSHRIAARTHDHRIQIAQRPKSYAFAEYGWDVDV